MSAWSAYDVLSFVHFSSFRL